jgi:CubicO group peptidase (beta-lactamase class C family)
MTYKTLAVLASFLLYINLTSAQSNQLQIDSMFSDWNKTNTPGCAVGIVRNDTLIFSKGYGMANIENQIPITPKSIFTMCSVSKQFTAYCILLLEKQGSLKLNEDVHLYLPWVPEFGKKITIHNLLNHTSGIREYMELLNITGVGVDGMMTQDLAISIIKKQRTLNFNPGERYSYSNSNYILLAEIVKKVSGMSFNAFADSAIFKPLSMMNTHFQDNKNNNELMASKAYPYQQTDSIRFAADFVNVSSYGDGGLVSNIEDMAKWMNVFYAENLNNSDIITQMTRKGRLNNGEEINYGMGVEILNFRGLKVIAHSGAINNSYRIFVCTIPEIKMSFLVFSNVGDFEPWFKAFELAGLFVKKNNDSPKKEETKNADAQITSLNDTVTIKKYLGSYIDEEGLQINFRLDKSNLIADIFGQPFPLVKNGNTYSFINDSTMKFQFKDVSGRLNVYANYSARDPQFLLTKYDASKVLSDQELHDYTGTYESIELDCKYHIILKDQRLYLTSNKYNDIEMTPLGKDRIINAGPIMQHLLIERNKKDQIIGFKLNTRYLMNLKFTKL